ncbi:MAG: hypothetical protein U9N04_02585 [Patescibacteria group bacterium]|nr:hypothetical protein [Patescibacteria group bacterium]
MDYCLAIILIAIPVTLVTVVIFVEISRIEKQINKLHKEKREKIRDAKDPRSSLCYDMRFLDNEIEDYDLQIEGLEKKRRFLLDKIPFLKK